MRGRTVGRVLVAVVLLLAVTTFGRDGHLQVAGAESAAGAIGVTGPMTAGHPLGTVGVTSVCLEGSGPQEIRSVKPLGENDTLGVRRFTVVPADADVGMEGFARRPIDQQGRVDHRVVTRCDDVAERVSWLYVEVERPRTPTSSFHGLRIVSETGRRHDVDFSLTVCRDRCPEGVEDL